MGLGWPLLSRVQCSALYAVGPSTVAAAAFFTVVDFNADCTEKVASSGKPVGSLFCGTHGTAAHSFAIYCEHVSFS